MFELGLAGGGVVVGPVGGGGVPGRSREGGRRALGFESLRVEGRWGVRLGVWVSHGVGDLACLGGGST